MRKNLEVMEDAEDAGQQLSQPKQGKFVSKACPYLYTVNRALLDFDFEKVCSVSLSNKNIYACLVCGKYFQGRSTNTYAYLHSLEANHHVFINTSTKKFYCLPDDYEFTDPSLDDIKMILDPQLTNSEIEFIDKEPLISVTLDGHQYICGVVGLNNSSRGDHANSLIQALTHLPEFRNYFLKRDNYLVDGAPISELIHRLGGLTQRIWSPQIWRLHVSPHEFLQEVSLLSKHKFSLGVHGDPLNFFLWLVNRLEQDTVNASKKSGKTSSSVSKMFQGVIKLSVTKKKSVSKDRVNQTLDGKSEKYLPFFFLQLELATVTLFKDEKSIHDTVQQSIYLLLNKYDGKTTHYIPNLMETRSYIITKLPKCLVIHIKRFSKNYFVEEKNKSIVNFPFEELDMTNYVTEEVSKTQSTKYVLRSYICHNGDVKKGCFSARIHHLATDKWYNCDDMYLTAILPEDHLLAEVYILFYERIENNNFSSNVKATTSKASKKS